MNTYFTRFALIVTIIFSLGACSDDLDGSGPDRHTVLDGADSSDVGLPDVPDAEVGEDSSDVFEVDVPNDVSDAGTADTDSGADASEDVEADVEADTTDAPVENADCEGIAKCVLANNDGAEYTLGTDASGKVTFETEVVRTNGEGCGVLIEVSPEVHVACEGLVASPRGENCFDPRTTIPDGVQYEETVTCTLTGEPNTLYHITFLHSL